MEDETILEASLEKIKNSEGWARADEIAYLIKVIDEHPGILRRAMKRYPYLELRNVFSDELCYPEDSEEYLRANHWTSWNDSGWEYIWKRLMIETMIVYDNMPDGAKESFRILDTKEKYGSLRISFSGYNEELNTLETEASLLSQITCLNCGKVSHDSKGNALIYTTRGWIVPYCRKCFDNDWSRSQKNMTKKEKHELREHRALCREVYKQFRTEHWSRDDHHYTIWKYQYGWVYPVKTVPIIDDNKKES